MNISMYRNLLEKILFRKNESGLVLLPQLSNSEVEEGRHVTGSYQIPSEMFPDTCQVITLSEGEAFLAEVQNIIAKYQPKRIFVLSPWIHFRSLSTDFRKHYPRGNFEWIVMREVLESLEDDALLGLLMPQGFLRDRSAVSARQNLIEHHHLKYVVEHDHSPQYLGMPFIHHQFRACTLVMTKGGMTHRPITFIKYDDEAVKNPSILFGNIAQLVSGQTHETEYGYVHSEDLSAEYDLLYDLYDPKYLRETERHLAHFGDLKSLGELVDDVPTLNRTADANLLRQKDDENASDEIPVISGRDILANGEINREDTRYTIQPGNGDSRYFLQPGDICIRAIHQFHNSDSVLPMAEVTEDDLPLVADSTVIVVRFKPVITDDERELIRSYFRTRYFVKQLKVLGASIHLGRHILDRVQMPIPGAALKEALQDLRDAERAYLDWINEVKQTRQGLFDIPENRDTRIRIMSDTRRVRQRYRSAASIDDFATRVRTRFPHPIAYRWKIIETSYPNYEGYKHILECAEVTIAYLASIGILMAFEHKEEIGEVLSEANKLGEGKSNGKTFGYWKKVLDQVQSKLNRIGEDMAFYELLRFPDVSTNETVNQLGKQAFDYLYLQRNDDAHGEGPKGFEVEQAYRNAFAQLSNLLQSVEFITEYPLIYIEKTRRDTQTNRTFYDYRELMGDHHLVPIQREANIIDCELEAESLYLVDRDRSLHLLRPIFLYHQASRADRLAIFYLNKYYPDNDSCEMRSLELGDTVELQNISGQFIASKLLNPK